jgi:hypothetical protein
MKLVFHTSEDGSEIQIVHHDESIISGLSDDSGDPFFPSSLKTDHPSQT